MEQSRKGTQTGSVNAQRTSAQTQNLGRGSNQRSEGSLNFQSKSTTNRPEQKAGGNHPPQRGLHGKGDDRGDARNQRSEKR